VRRLLPIVVVLAAAGAARGGEPTAGFARASRVAVLDHTIAALQRLGRDRLVALDDQLAAGARTRCQSALGPPSPRCLLDLAGDTCAAGPGAGRDDCLLAADVVLANLLAENDRVDRRTRMRLVVRGGDYRAGLRAELDGRYAALVAELVLAEPGGERDLPARIDRFCADRDHSLDWQRCVAAIVWYAAMHPGGKS